MQEARIDQSARLKIERPAADDQSRVRRVDDPLPQVYNEEVKKLF